MQPKPLVLRFAIQGVPFAVQFLESDDFDGDTLRDICKVLGVASSGTKGSLIKQLDSFLENNRDKRADEAIMNGLIHRHKKWFAFRYGHVGKLPTLEDPYRLIREEGTPGWYGPIQDSENGAIQWYIRTRHPAHWELDETSQKPIQRQIRWLCFARIAEDIVSLHWQGFSIAEEIGEVDHEAQFPYWNYVPTCFAELEKTLGVEFQNPNLQDLVLYRMWDQYRLNPTCVWDDLRIRAESGGVSLNARASGGDAEIDVKGIKHLAQTLTASVQRELQRCGANTPDLAYMREALLRTLIREFGTKSYEFSLESKEGRLLKAHIYFGMKSGFPGPDCFPHVNCHTSWRTDKEQLEFLLGHMRPEDWITSDKQQLEMAF